jgi:zinc and cadmium transporter
METLLWILLATFGMSLISLIGLATLAVREEVLKKMLLILVSFSAGALLGGAFLHLLPNAINELGLDIGIFIWVLVGFSIFFLMEQFLQLQHSHRVSSDYKKPVSYLILIADGLHNFIGGLAIAGSFMVSPTVGIITWIACAAHEIPQELGDFGILIYSGWKKFNALIYNFISALLIVPAGILTYFISANIDTTFLLPFAAGNFIYIAASDLIPEVKHGELKNAIWNFIAFLIGILLILGVRFLFG